MRLHLIARLDDRHVSERAHRCDVLERHLAGPVVTDADPHMRSHETNICLVVSDRKPHRFLTTGDERAERACERDLAVQRKAGRDTDHVRLGDADVEEPVRILRREVLDVRRVLEVSGERDDALVAPDANQGISECLARCDVAHRYPLLSISAIARAACSAFGAFPCQL